MYIYVYTIILSSPSLLVSLLHIKGKERQKGSSDQRSDNWVDISSSTGRGWSRSGTWRALSGGCCRALSGGWCRALGVCCQGCGHGDSNKEDSNGDLLHVHDENGGLGVPWRWRKVLFILFFKKFWNLKNKIIFFF